jgi:hypothetical protein
MNGVFVTWIDDREAANGISSNVQLFATRSLDGGSTWLPAARINRMPDGVGGTCECCNTSMAASAEGHIAVSFRSNISNRRDVFVVQSHDRGESFQPAVAGPSEMWYQNACPMSGSSVRFDRDGNVHVAWRDARPSLRGGDGIFYTSVDDSASVAATDVLASDSPNRVNYASLAIGRQGELLIAYQDSRSDDADAMLSLSVDGGNTFLPSTKMTDEIGASRQELPAIVMSASGSVYAVWSDTRRDAGDILFRRTTTLPAPVLPAKPTAAWPTTGSSVPSVSMFSWYPPSNLGNARHVKYTLRYWTSGGSPTSVDEGNRS